jgi:hypothetical protein
MIRFARSRHSLLARAAALTCALLIAVSATVVPARAQSTTVEMHPDNGRFVGLITNYQGTPLNPISFTLQLGLGTVDLHTYAKTALLPQSAEAELEGMANGEYALVFTRKMKGQWMAFRIRYDVEPVLPLRKLSGTVLRVSPDGMHFQMKLDTTMRNVFIRISKDARYLGVVPPATGEPPQLMKGELLDVTGLFSGGWVAYEIDVKGTAMGLHGGPG